jgi:signal transduction histidine kinase
MSSEPNSPPTRRRSLAGRITTWYVIAFIAMLALIAASAIPALRDAVRHEEAVIVDTKVERHVALLTSSGLPTYENAVEHSAQLGDDKLAVRVQDAAGNTLFQRGDLSASLRTASRTTRELRVDVGAARDPWTTLRDRMRPGMLVLLLAAIVLAIASGFLLTRKALRPIRTLATTAREVSVSGDLSRRVPISNTNDELDELSQLFNRMLDRNQRLVRGMREALDNVAHDLRTPLTRLRGNAEVALRSGDSTAAKEALGETIEESERVMAMLRTMMDISEAESGIMRLDRSRVPLVALVNDAVSLYEHVADEAGVVIDTIGDERVVVDVDAARIRQVVANLLDNAIKYNHRGGRVTVEVTANDDDAIVRVSDTGEGIPTDALPRIWDRLYRADPSRTRPGLGLGLSLVKAVVDAHGGAVDVQSEPGKGAVFTLRLPRPPVAPPIGDHDHRVRRALHPRLA